MRREYRWHHTWKRGTENLEDFEKDSVEGRPWCWEVEVRPWCGEVGVQLWCWEVEVRPWCGEVGVWPWYWEVGVWPWCGEVGVWPWCWEVGVWPWYWEVGIQPWCWEVGVRPGIWGFEIWRCSQTIELLPLGQRMEFSTVAVAVKILGLDQRRWIKILKHHEMCQNVGMLLA